MPQMYPMNWLILPLIFITLLILMMTLLFFTTSTLPKSLTHQVLTLPNNKWTW